MSIAATYYWQQLLFYSGWLLVMNGGPSFLEKIKDFCQIQVRESYQRQEAVQLVLNIACWERLLPDLEKLIYLWQKKHKKGMENYVIRLYIRSAGGVDQKELRKAKLRLEHRFRGLTVYYCKTGEEHVVLYPEG